MEPVLTESELKELQEVRALFNKGMVPGAPDLLEQWQLDGIAMAVTFLGLAGHKVDEVQMGARYHIYDGDRKYITMRPSLWVKIDYIDAKEAEHRYFEWDFDGVDFAMVSVMDTQGAFMEAEAENAAWMLAWYLDNYVKGV